MSWSFLFDLKASLLAEKLINNQNMLIRNKIKIAASFIKYLHNLSKIDIPSCCETNHSLFVAWKYLKLFSGKQNINLSDWFIA